MNVALCVIHAKAIDVSADVITGNISPCRGTSKSQLQGEVKK
jgi:hypothetical protein